MLSIFMACCDSQQTGMYIASPSHPTLPMLLISLAALDFMILLAPADSVATVHKHRPPFNKISAILTEIEANLSEPLEEIERTVALEAKVTPTAIGVALADAMGRAGTVAVKMSAAGAVAQDFARRSAASSTFTSRSSNLAKTS